MQHLLLLVEKQLSSDLQICNAQLNAQKMMLSGLQLASKRGNDDFNWYGILVQMQ